MHACMRCDWPVLVRHALVTVTAVATENILEAAGGATMEGGGGGGGCGCHENKRHEQHESYATRLFNNSVRAKYVCGSTDIPMKYTSQTYEYLLFELFPVVHRMPMHESGRTGMHWSGRSRRLV